MQVMTFWQFAADSPFLTFFAIYMITVTIYRCVVWICRCLNIRKHGWPPPHCDADGDLRQVSDEGDAEADPGPRTLCGVVIQEVGDPIKDDESPGCQRCQASIRKLNGKLNERMP